MSVSFARATPEQFDQAISNLQAFRLPDTRTGNDLPVRSRNLDAALLHILKLAPAKKVAAAASSSPVTTPAAAAASSSSASTSITRSSCHIETQTEADTVKCSSSIETQTEADTVKCSSSIETQTEVDVSEFSFGTQTRPDVSEYSVGTQTDPDALDDSAVAEMQHHNTVVVKLQARLSCALDDGKKALADLETERESAEHIHEMCRELMTVMIDSWRKGTIFHSQNPQHLHAFKSALDAVQQVADQWKKSANNLIVDEMDAALKSFVDLELSPSGADWVGLEQLARQDLELCQVSQQLLTRVRALSQIQQRPLPHVLMMHKLFLEWLSCNLSRVFCSWLATKPGTSTAALERKSNFAELSALVHCFASRHATFTSNDGVASSLHFEALKNAISDYHRAASFAAEAHNHYRCVSLHLNALDLARDLDHLSGGVPFETRDTVLGIVLEAPSDVDFERARIARVAALRQSDDYLRHHLDRVLALGQSVSEDVQTSVASIRTFLGLRDRLRKAQEFLHNQQQNKTTHTHHSTQGKKRGLDAQDQDTSSTKKPRSHEHRSFMPHNSAR